MHGWGHIGGKMFEVLGQPIGHDGGMQGCGHMLTVDWTTVQPCGQICGGQGDGQLEGLVAIVVGQYAGQLGGWHGWGHDGIRQFAGQAGGKHGDGHADWGGGICCVNLLGEK